MKIYSQDFYENRHKKTAYSANTIISILLEREKNIQSAVDVGCGVGTWLSVLQEKGVKEIQGVDGGWVNRDLLVVPKESFIQIDLGRATVKLPRKFDLAISLEVAEHLPADRADEFVNSLAALSDRILFSAAIPFQEGRGHINEQWQQYWVKKFSTLGYDAHDFIRPRIWADDQIPFWYKQNVLFFLKRDASRNIAADIIGFNACVMPIDVVHPELYLMRTKTRISVKKSFKIFIRALREYIIRKLLGKDS